MRRLSDTLLPRCLLGAVIIILILIPFHATLTVWLASIFGHYTAFRLWKEVLLLCITSISIGLLAQNKELRSRLFTNTLLRPVIWCIGIYVVLHIIATSFALLRDEVTLQALGYGLISDFRFLVFFLVCIVAGSYWGSWIKVYWKQLLLMPAGIVVTFGLLQAYVLPIDTLQHIGYRSDTIAPYITVDEKIEFIRLQSTLRGPNPLGAYLVLITTALAGMLIIKKMRSWQLILSIIGTLVVLYGTYSRSAWIGAVFSIIVLIWLLAGSAYVRKLLVLSGGVLLLLGAGTVFVLRDNDYIQNTLFHTDEKSLSQTSSNESRAGAIHGGVKDVVVQPYGRGTGTAGPASVYNNDNARISENYFLQIAQEVGILGLGVFITICCLVGRTLWRIREWGLLPIILLASLIGLSVVNVVSHAWADDTLAYLWWGFAGLTIGSALLFNKKKTGDGKKTI